VFRNPCRCASPPASLGATVPEHASDPLHPGPLGAGAAEASSPACPSGMRPPRTPVQAQRLEANHSSPRPACVASPRIQRAPFVAVVQVKGQGAFACRSEDSLLRLRPPAARRGAVYGRLSAESTRGERLTWVAISVVIERFARSWAGPRGSRL